MAKTKSESKNKIDIINPGARRKNISDLDAKRRDNETFILYEENTRWLWKCAYCGAINQQSVNPVKCAVLSCNDCNTDFFKFKKLKEKHV